MEGLGDSKRRSPRNYELAYLHLVLSDFAAHISYFFLVNSHGHCFVVVAVAVAVAVVVVVVVAVAG